MKEFYKKRFALTDKGAGNLSKATLSSFFVYCINMLPAILLMIFAQEVLENISKSKGFYAGKIVNKKVLVKPGLFCFIVEMVSFGEIEFFYIKFPAVYL